MDAGFTLIELVLALAIITIASVIGFEGYYNALPAFRANSAMQHLEAELRFAREVSIDQRRYVTVTFQGTSELVAWVDDVNGNPVTQLYDYFLPEGMTYVLFSGVPDTPDGYGNSSAVTYNCPSPLPPSPSFSCKIAFNSDGSVTDGQSGSSNGSIFIGIAGQTNTARAVTILSATGKIKGWHYAGTGWN